MTTIKLVGFSALAFALIPAALALGATGWLGFTVSLHVAQVTNSQEHRRAIYVDSPQPQQAPMKINVTRNRQINVDRVDLDGGKMTVYLHNVSGVRQCFQRVRWSILSPNDTIVSQGGAYAGDYSGGMLPGDKLEAIEDVGTDERGVSMRVSVTSQDACP